MADDMVERVAMAIFKADSSDLVTWEDDAAIWEKVAYRNLARAAIEAMRELVETMIDAGFHKDVGWSYEHIWRNMIDDALRRP